MRRCENEAAIRQMGAHKSAETLLRRGVERAHRLIKEPYRTLDGKQPRNRQPAALPGRKVGRWQLGERIEPDRLQRRLNCRRPAGKKPRPESQVFGRRQGRFQRILVTDIVGLLGDGQLRIAAFQRQIASYDADKADDGSQQRGFAGAIAAGNRQDFTGGHGKAYAGEHVAAAAVTGEINSAKPHRRHPRREQTTSTGI